MSLFHGCLNMWSLFIDLAFCYSNFFFNLWMTEVLFVGSLIPLFWTSGDVYPGFQSQGISLLHAFLLV